MPQIYIKDMRLHAFHGVLPQERVVGNDYVINVVVDYPFEAACLSDDVADTLNYAELAEVIKQEMAVQSNLLEHVAHRICTAIIRQFPKTRKVSIDLRKVTPPMSVDCSGAGVRVQIEN